jgi:hypothetical protein
VHHEKIHFWQQVELLFVFHWMFYAFFYMVARFKGHCHYIAYRYNPFELEAFGNDPDFGYLKKRRPFAWVNYVPKYYTILSENTRAMAKTVPIDKKIRWKKVA